MNNKIKLSYILLLFVISFSIIYSQNKQYENLKSLTIELLNAPDSIYLYLWDDIILDSALVINGKGHCKFSAGIQPEYLRITNKGTGPEYRYKYLWVDTSDVKISGDYSDFRNLQVKGSESNKIAESYLEIQRKYEDVIQKLKEIESGEEHKFDFTTQILSRQGEYRTELISAMKKENSSYVTLFYLSWECINNNLSKPEILDVYNSLTPDLQNSEPGRNIKHFTGLPNVPNIGDKFIDFVQFTPEGDTVSLSDYKGKITLIYYFSFGCYACFLENPILIGEYNKYNQLGLEILGVSDESDKTKWIKNLKETNFPWQVVTDFKGMFNEAAMLYNFRMTPHNILIDKDGIITHRNLRGDNLKKVLSEIIK